MLEIIGADASGKASQNWHQVWQNSRERQHIQARLAEIHADKQAETVAGAEPIESGNEFATDFASQLFYVTHRVFQQYWRTPSYIFGKYLLGIVAALYVFSQ